MLQQPFSLSIEQGQPGDADEPVQPGSDQRDQRMGCGNRDLDRSCGCPTGRDGLLNDGESIIGLALISDLRALVPPSSAILSIPALAVPPLLQKVTLPLCRALIRLVFFYLRSVYISLRRQASEPLTHLTCPFRIM